jgi:hypothetical protein
VKNPLEETRLRLKQSIKKVKRKVPRVTKKKQNENLEGKQTPPRDRTNSNNGLLATTSQTLALQC